MIRILKEAETNRERSLPGRTRWTRWRNRVRAILAQVKARGTRR